MQNSIVIGQYYQADSFLHKLDPRTKIIITFLYMIFIFTLDSFVLYGLTGLYLIFLIYISGVPVKVLIRSLRQIVFLLVFAFILNMFFYRNGEFIEIWFFKIYLDGVKLAFKMFLRLIYLVLGTSLMTLTTTPLALTDAIERLFSPLKKLKLPVHEMTLMMSIALRFIPTLINEANRIKSAQMARGADFETGNIIKKVKALIPILIPLFISAFKRADELADAMDSRCYNRGIGRTKMKELRYSKNDLIAFVFSIVFFVSLIIVEFNI